MIKIIVFLLIFIFSAPGFSLNFTMPTAGNRVVGKPATAMVQDGEDFSDIAERFDIGYYEEFEANPGVDPDKPPVNTVLVIPTKYVLPTELKPNSIIINLVEMRLYYLPKDHKTVYIFPVGIGKEDWDTPLGEMRVIKKIKAPKWVVPDSIFKFRQSIGDPIKKVMPPGPDNPLGSYELRLSGGNYLIHGTNLPAGVGRRSSAGCIRLYEQDISQLYNMVELGTKVVIINKPYKAGWDNKDLYLEAHMPLFEQRIEMGDDVKPAINVVQAAIKGHKITIDWKNVTNVAKEHLTVARKIN